MYTLYAIPPSLFAGKARSYLIKNRIAYEEVSPQTKHFEQVVLPKAGGRNSMPTNESEDGVVVRDGAAILDHFEAQNGHRSTPQTPRQRVVSQLIDVIAMEWLMRPTTHYRWNYVEENGDLIPYHFTTMTPVGRDPRRHGELLMKAMTQWTEILGCTPETIPGIERRYEALLPLLSQHFEAMPYLLGGRPCIGDYSLIAPFFGHLGRDPKPLSMMQATAIHLFRWVERMNRPGLAHVDYVEDGEEIFGDSFLPDDQVPQTLIAVLRHLAIDFVPETVASAETINGWLARKTQLEGGTPVKRYVGSAEFEVEGETLHAVAQPYRHFLLNRVQSTFDALAPEDRRNVEAMLDDCHMTPVLDARLTRGIGRANNLEVWLDA